MSMRLFQESCGYVTQKCDLVSGLTVKQTLSYAAHMTIGSKVTDELMGHGLNVMGHGLNINFEILVTCFIVFT